MPIVLRPYQIDCKQKVYDAWQAGFKNILLVKPTGLGKTKTFCSITMDMAIKSADRMPTAIVVHRKELVQQISLTLAEEEIIHNIIAPRPVIKGIIAAHRRILRRQFYDYNSAITVVSVDTLLARIEKHKRWAEQIRLWITDEAAHVLANNKWGRALAYFPNAIGLGVTATPHRLDKKGLGRHADGIFDCMVEGPSTRWGIDQGFLCKYKIAIPSSDYQRFLGKATDGSDYSKRAMIDASTKSHIVGDVVENYLKFAGGKQSILFTTDIVTGKRMEERFQAAGVEAKLLTSESTDKERLEGLIHYKEKKIKVLINIDLFDEGLDVPGIECVQMARPTKSLGKFLQMIGRGLRPAPGKEHLIVIDHVGNVTEHGLPDQRRKWTLDRIVKRREKTNFIRICSNITCNAPYDRLLTECPWCGADPYIEYRSSSDRPKVLPKEVDGDLELLDPETLRNLESQAVLEDPGVVAKRVSFAINGAAGIKAMKAQQARIETQKELSHIIAKWAGMWKHRGYSDRQIHKCFYLNHEMTITEALGLPRAEMLDILENLESELPIRG